jgi:serine/threonine protein phosphatase 1
VTGEPPAPGHVARATPGAGLTGLPGHVDYPVIAVADLHGQREELERLVARLESLPEWPDCALVFLGDFVDRGDDVPGTVELVLELLGRRPGGSAVTGNHDLALVRAARLDGGPASPYWAESYRTRYDHENTFLGYLGRRPDRGGGRWGRDLEELGQAVPQRHRTFVASLPWVVEAAGHLFLHCGLSPELGASPQEQVAAMHRRGWDRSALKPRPGTLTEALWQAEYPAWLGADRGLSERPLAYPGKVQVTGHVPVPGPDVNRTRIRLDTSGGFGHLTACLLRSPNDVPKFVTSRP